MRPLPIPIGPADKKARKKTTQPVGGRDTFHTIIIWPSGNACFLQRTRSRRWQEPHGEPVEHVPGGMPALEATDGRPHPGQCPCGPVPERCRLAQAARVSWWSAPLSIPRQWVGRGGTGPQAVEGAAWVPRGVPAVPAPGLHGRRCVAAPSVS